jgi:hypothetical protein
MIRRPNGPNAHSPGFSLVELIASLLLMGIIGGIWGLGMVQVIEGFLHSRQSAETFMKGQMSMARMVKELRMASALETDPAPSADAISFVRTDDGRDRETRINHDPGAGTVNLNGEVLVDDVRRFYLTYAETYEDDPPPLANTLSALEVPEVRLITIHLDLNGPQDTVVRFETRVFLRGLG